MKLTKSDTEYLLELYNNLRSLVANGKLEMDLSKLYDLTHNTKLSALRAEAGRKGAAAKLAKAKGKVKDVEQKKRYAEHVRMFEREYMKFVQVYGQRMADRFVEVLENYKASSGTAYKDDAAAIRSWVINRVAKEHGKTGEQLQAKQAPVARAQDFKPMGV